MPVSSGVDLDYFTRDDGFARAMVDVANPKGVVWIDGVCVVPDEEGRPRLVARFSRRPGLEKAYEQGMMGYNDDRELFEVVTNLPLVKTWRMLQSHPVRVRMDDTEYLVLWPSVSIDSRSRDARRRVGSEQVRIVFVYRPERRSVDRCTPAHRIGVARLAVASMSSRHSASGEAVARLRSDASVGDTVHAHRFG